MEGEGRTVVGSDGDDERNVDQSNKVTVRWAERRVLLVAQPGRSCAPQVVSQGRRAESGKKNGPLQLGEGRVSSLVLSGAWTKLIGVPKGLTVSKSGVCSGEGR